VPREIPASWPGLEADYARCVDIVPRARCARMVLPGHAGRSCPRGGRLRPSSSLGGEKRAIGAKPWPRFLMVGTIAVILARLVLNNAGGGLGQTRKKYSRGGPLRVDGQGGGKKEKKKSEPHKAADRGDTVGAIPSRTRRPVRHVLIKLLSRSRWCWRLCSS